MSRMRIVLVAIAGLALFTALVVAGSRNSPGGGASAAPAKYAPGEEELGASDAFWNQRLTYPTGRFNPAWLRAAATQAAAPFVRDLLVITLGLRQSMVSLPADGGRVSRKDR